MVEAQALEDELGQYQQAAARLQHVHAREKAAGARKGRGGELEKRGREAGWAPAGGIKKSREDRGDDGGGAGGLVDDGKLAKVLPAPHLAQLHHHFLRAIELIS